MRFSTRNITTQFSLLLFALTSLGAAQSAVGVRASGTVTLAGPRGSERGTITVEAWGQDRCKIEIRLGPAILHREYTVLVNGQRAVINAPSGMAARAPLPIGPRLGCALLPGSLAYNRIAAGTAQLSLDPATRLPTGLTWSVGEGRAVSLTYSDYRAGAAPLAAKVTETVAGDVRLQIRFDSIAVQSLTEADFTLPPLAKPSGAAGSGGGK